MGSRGVGDMTRIIVTVKPWVGPAGPGLGLAGPFDHLVKGEREEAIRVWYGNAEQ